MFYANEHTHHSTKHCLGNTEPSDRVSLLTFNKAVHAPSLCVCVFDPIPKIYVRLGAYQQANIAERWDANRTSRVWLHVLICLANVYVWFWHVCAIYSEEFENICAIIPWNTQSACLARINQPKTRSTNIINNLQVAHFHRNHLSPQNLYHIPPVSGVQHLFGFASLLVCQEVRFRQNCVRPVLWSFIIRTILVSLRRLNSTEGRSWWSTRGMC